MHIARKAIAVAVLAMIGITFIAAPHARAQNTSALPITNAGAAPTGTGADDVSSESASDLAKKLQNPVGDLYSFPFQNNTNFNYGPNKGTQDILNIQPVIPIHLNENWNLITRTILPLIWQPSLAPAHTVPFGTSATVFSAFVSPSNPVNGWLWAVGPVLQIPTASDKTLGSNVWGGGPTGAIVYMQGPVVMGALVNNIWSFGGTSGPSGTKYNNFLLQPFGNYNFGGGWYLTTGPIVTANWEAAGNKAWTLPVGGGFGRVIKLGKLPVNFGLSAYYNVLRPEFGATWQLRTQVTLIF